MCVSTGKAGTPKACAISTDAVLWPTPGNASSASKLAGTSPPWRSTSNCAIACRFFAFVGARPISRMYSRITSTGRAAIAAGVGAASKSAGVTSLTFLSVV
jgi:hypothetical protein